MILDHLTSKSYRHYTRLTHCWQSLAVVVLVSVADYASSTFGCTRPLLITYSLTITEVHMVAFTVKKDKDIGCCDAFAWYMIC